MWAQVMASAGRVLALAGQGSPLPRGRFAQE